MNEKNLVGLAQSQVEDMVKKAVEKATEAGELPEVELPSFVVEIPADTAHGDFASNIAMAGAKAYRKAPRAIAETIVSHLNFEGTYFKHAEIAGPGFINLFLDNRWFVHVVQTIESLGEGWGETDFGGGEKVMVEFVSANPTGPMHLGNARGGVIGDSLASALNAAGFKADREFYLNDSGNQIQRFGDSLEARYIGIAMGEAALVVIPEGLEDDEAQQFIKTAEAQGKHVFPQDGYHGDDITRRAQEYFDSHGDELMAKPTDQRRSTLVDFALPLNVAAMKGTLEKYRIVYDTWFHESTVYEDNTLEKVLKILEDKGLTYQKDGAMWYKATAFGEEKDEVLVRGNGNPTYFAGDISYHYNKFVVRGYQRVINLWGADHHGHVARMKNAMTALGLDGDKLDILLFQLVRLIKDGEPYRMSKRTGRSVTLEDLLEIVPVDAARFFFNMRESGATMDFDLDLAVKEESSNPVHYVQYAPARINSVLKRVQQEGTLPRKVTEKELALLTHPSELALIRRLAQYPNVIINVAVRYETSALTHYALEVANDFHKFYHDCRVLGEDEALMQARIALCIATKITLTNLLGLLKINVPEYM